MPAIAPQMKRCVEPSSTTTTYNSPQLLMLSGVGPAGALDALEIPVVLDQPLVGHC